MKKLVNNILMDLTPEEILQVEVDAQNAGISHRRNARAKRDALLSETDWSQGKDVPPELSMKYLSYRQALRDITLQSGFPDNIQWPQKPQ